MTEIEALRGRVVAARDEFRQVPGSGPHRLGPPDPATGEQWSAGNVLGHMANILPFWSGQISAALEGSTWIGRGENGYESRKQAIEAGATADEAKLRSEIEQGIDTVLQLLDRIRPDQLDLEVEHRRAAETKVKSIRVLLDQILVSHLEAHVRQYRELRSATAQTG